MKKEANYKAKLNFTTKLKVLLLHDNFTESALLLQDVMQHKNKLVRSLIMQLIICIYLLI